MPQTEASSVEENFPIVRRSLHQELTGRLRDLIIEGNLAPGLKIPERDLCARFAVSRTPLREALKVLASEGLVLLTPNRGASVTQLTKRELEEAFPVMGALEALSGSLACAHMTDEEIWTVGVLHEEMVGHYKVGDRSNYFRCNEAIHSALLNGSRNKTLASTHQILAGRVRRARFFANNSEDRWRQAVLEHHLILEALRKREGSRLAEILQEHLRNKLKSVIEHLK